MTEKESPQSFEVKISAALMHNLKVAADSQGITVKEATENAVESYLKMFEEVIGSDALEDPAVQAMIKGFFPDEGTGRRGVVLKLPGVATETETQ